MNDNSLLPYYLKELSAFRELGARFASDHPDIAHHLQFDSGFGQNPQLAQLIESIVFMNARVSHQFEQEYPLLIASLINIFYPYLTSPLPSMAIIQWQVDKNIEKSFQVLRGTLLETDPSIINSARFSTTYDLDVHPIEIKNAEFIADTSILNFTKPVSQFAIKIQIACSHKKINFSSLLIKNLRFHIDNQKELSYYLYELLMNECSGIGIVEAAGNIHHLDAQSIRSVGFADDQALLPHDARTLSGNRLLTEFFAFPQKFLFFDLINFPSFALETQELEIYFYFDRKANPILEKLNSACFQLNCTPIINLFEKTVEPLALNTHFEYPIITDLRQPQNYEIYKINEVVGVFENEQQVNYQSLLASQHSKYRWQAHRVPAAQVAGNRLVGTEMMLTVTHAANVPTPVVLMIDTLCTNRLLTEELLQQASPPSLQPIYGTLPTLNIRWIGKLTPPRSPLMQSQNAFLLLESLSKNLISFCENQGSLLKNLLQIYTPLEKNDTQALIDNMKSASCQRSSAFINHDGHYGYFHGMKITIDLKHSTTNSHSSWLFFNVLEKFFSDLTPINSFIQLQIMSQEEEIYQWPIHTGERALI